MSHTRSVGILLAGLIAVLATVGVITAQGPKPGNARVPATSLSTAFTYQGQLKKNGAVVNSNCTMTFDLYDAASGGAHVAGPVTGSPAPVSVANGLFTVQVDFGPGFKGDAYWLQTTVACTGDGSATPLPLTPITAAPYALGLVPGATISATRDSDVFAVSNYGSGDAINGYNYGTGSGVYAYSDSYPAVNASSNSIGVKGTGPIGVKGVSGTSGLAFPPAASGVWGESSSGTGVYGASYSSTGVFGGSATGPGVQAYSGGYNPLEAYGPGFGNRLFYVSQAGNVYADGTFNPGGADFAEMLPGASGLEPGDVLVIGGDGKLARSTQPNQPNVVGVHSTKPGFLGGAGEDNDLTGKIPLAILGIVPVKVSNENGAIQIGDMLVASSTRGHAMKAGNNPGVGTIIGKALQSLDTSQGVITMLVMMR